MEQVHFGSLTKRDLLITRGSTSAFSVVDAAWYCWSMFQSHKRGFFFLCSTFLKKIKVTVDYITILEYTILVLGPYFIVKGKWGKNPHFKSAFYRLFNSIGTMIIGEQPFWVIFWLNINLGHFGSNSSFWVW